MTVFDTFTHLYKIKVMTTTHNMNMLVLLLMYIT